MAAVPLREAARIVGVTHEAVRKYVQAGMPTAGRGANRAVLVDPQVVRRWRRDHAAASSPTARKGPAPSLAADDGGGEAANADAAGRVKGVPYTLAQLRIIQAAHGVKERELELKVREGRYVEAADVERQVARHARRLAGLLDQLARRIADDAASALGLDAAARTAVERAAAAQIARIREEAASRPFG